MTLPQSARDTAKQTARRVKAAARHYSFGEEIAHTLTHGIGVIAGLVAMVFLVEKAGRGDEITPVVAVGIYGASMVFLYACSTIYHGSFESRFQPFFKMLDHSAIYVKIAGTYTPFALITLPFDVGLPILIAVWTTAALGIGFKVFGYVFNLGERFRWLSLLTYIAMGWTGILIVGDMYDALSAMGFTWLMLGAGCFTLGAVVYAIKRIPYGHAIWHVFVLAGSTCHFFSVYGAIQ